MPTRSPTEGGAARRRSGAWAAALVLAAILGVIGARGFLARPAVRREAGLNVLLVTIDTLRADAVGAYGRAGVATPWIDRLAAAGVRFERARAQNVVTLPSHANILSGRHPYDHGVRDNSGFRYPQGAETLATLLKKQGYRTGAFVSAFPLDSRFGLDRGFDVYDDRFGDAEADPAFRMAERPGPETVSAALAWISARQDTPFFCWVHLYEPHAPYEPPEPLASRFRSEPYLGEVSAADEALKPLLEPLLAAAPAVRTLVVLTSDHGESLGEHGERTHGIFAYEATLRVPLIVHAPRLFPPRVVEDPVQHVDLLPTILDALSLPVPAGLPGRSLLALAAGLPGGPALGYFESLTASTNRGWAPLHGVIRGALKYVELPIPELYDLASDPAEARNLVAEQPPALAELRELLRGLRASDKGVQRVAEGAEVRERLKSLGYLSSSSTPAKERYSEDDDPKRLIAVASEIDEVMELYEAGELSKARALCEDIVRRQPGISLSWLQLAYLNREAGDLPGAAEAARSALRASPDNVDAASLLGAYLNESGRAPETVALLSPYARRSDPDLDVLNALGAALAQTGRAAEGLAMLERVLGVDPSNALTHLNIGTIHLMSRDYARARAAFEAALTLEPTLARAHNSVGVIEAETGNQDAAIEAWKKAVSLNPREYDTLYNLGTLLIRRGRASEARRYLEQFERGAPKALYGPELRNARAWLKAPRPGPSGGPE